MCSIPLCTVDREIFTGKIFFCWLLRRRKLNAWKFFYGEWLEHMHTPCGENKHANISYAKKKGSAKISWSTVASKHKNSLFTRTILPIRSPFHFLLGQSLDPFMIHYDKFVHSSWPCGHAIYHRRNLSIWSRYIVKSIISKLQLTMETPNHEPSLGIKTFPVYEVS